MGFTPRLTRPEAGNKYYITKSAGGYSGAVKGSPTDSACNVLHNCVGYAYGRFNEIGGWGSCKYLSPVNAENFIKYKGSLEVGQEPRLGACMVWQAGATLNGSDGAGHVAIVEKIVSPTEVVTSESGWNAANAFWTQTRKKGSDGNWGQGSNYKFLGFIYNPAECCTGAGTTTEKGGESTMKYTSANPPMQCFMRQSTWYQKTGTLPVKGVLVHSTGANNPTIKRYVQPDDNAADRAEMLALIGTNNNHNDWNHIYHEAGVHAWIGKLASGEVAAVQVGPWNKEAWGCGPGKYGSCNQGWIQFEICEDGLADKTYFEKVYREAVELTAYLCKLYNLDPHGKVTHCGVKNVPVILCHQDSYQYGLGCNHGDVLHWFPKFGKSMEDFRNDVTALMNASGGAVVNPTPAVPEDTSGFKAYTVNVKVTGLNIRSGPGTNYASKGYIAPGIYTIVAESAGQGATLWGKLKSGADWISLDFMENLAQGNTATGSRTKVMGTAVATAAQMRSYIRSVNPSVAQSVIDMIPLYLSEGAAEGVRGDIAFAQSCLETGNFGFKGSAVTLDQNNFCGMGVTSNGMKGNSFGTPQLGIRAQIQHLKAYASKDTLKNECIDPRFNYVTRGCAEYVEWLGQQENPGGNGWATGAQYGEKILKILKSIVSIKINEEDDDMDVARFKELFDEMRGGLQDNDSGDWSQDARSWAVGTGLVVGSGGTINGEPNCMWQDFMTREQLVTVLYRFAKLMGAV